MDKPLVLIVDDEPRLLDSLFLLLKGEFDVITATNGREGLSSFRERPSISMILLDLDMPVMNGVEALEEIRGISNDVKVIIMTGRSSHHWARQCANLNVQGYIDKPFDIEELINKIKKLLGKEDFKLLKKLWGEEYEMRKASSSQLVKNTLHYIEKNFHINFNIKQISAHFEVTHEYLSRKFSKECGMILIEYIKEIRLEKSKEYLAVSPPYKIGEVASFVGISDISYYGRIFKKHTGFTPAQFRNSIQTPKS